MVDLNIIGNYLVSTTGFLIFSCGAEIKFGKSNIQYRIYIIKYRSKKKISRVLYHLNISRVIKLLKINTTHYIIWWYFWRDGSTYTSIEHIYRKNDFISIFIYGM